MLDKAIQRVIQQIQFELSICWFGATQEKNPSYNLLLIGWANNQEEDVIIKEYSKTWGSKMLSAEQMDGECAKIPSSISWTYKVRSSKQNEES